MLRRKQRLTRVLVEKIMRQGVSHHTPHLSLRLIRLQTKTEEASRFSFIIPKKILSLATKRNYMRRKGMHLLQKYLSVIPKSFAGIFFIKKNADKLEVPELEQEIFTLLKKAKLA